MQKLRAGKRAWRAGGMQWRGERVKAAEARQNTRV